MYIDDKLAEGYVVVCDGGGEQHSFLVRNLSLSVQCPSCGKVELSVDLATDFVMRQADPQGNVGSPQSMPRMAQQAVGAGD
ncbi:MAG TPA: hypothetical protein VE631_07735 [Alphaproteobacteria bacterium]|nr:hypothetical protein [Alphaproteobacteria bacterium]